MPITDNSFKQNEFCLKKQRMKRHVKELLLLSLEEEHKNKDKKN